MKLTLLLIKRYITKGQWKCPLILNPSFIHFTILVGGREIIPTIEAQKTHQYLAAKSDGLPFARVRGKRDSLKIPTFFRFWLFIPNFLSWWPKRPLLCVCYLWNSVDKHAQRKRQRLPTVTEHGDQKLPTGGCNLFETSRIGRKQISHCQGI